MNYVTIGKIGAPHGIRGWVKVYSFTDPQTNLLSYRPWWIQSQKMRNWQAYTLESHKISSGTTIVKLEGIDDRDTAQTLTHALIGMPREGLPALDENEYYWTDLEGLTVVNKDHKHLGTVDHLMNTGANDILVVKGPDKAEYWIPYLEHTILNVSLVDQTITVDWE